MRKTNKSIVHVNVRSMRVMMRVVKPLIGSSFSVVSVMTQ